MKDGVEAARKAIDSGAAKVKLNQFVMSTSQVK
jgi:anthranilate phosphoribosyltransferase